MSTGDNSSIRLLATGDVGPVHGPSDGFPIERYSELVKPVIESADLLVGNCERTYSRRGVPMTARSSMKHSRQPPEMSQIFDDCGFHVLTTANNHMFDWGADALLDTRELLISKGIKVTGSGKDLDQAREPAIFEKNGVKVGFLAYGTQIAPGGDAQVDKPGIALLRTTASYDVHGVHAPVRVKSAPDASDLAMIIDDIQKLKDRVDIVIPAFHWGIPQVPRVVCDYQETVAHACIDAGADMIIGHHPHIPKAIEVYQGKAIFYSLSNFCVTAKSAQEKERQEQPWRHGALGNSSDVDPDYPLMPFGEDGIISMLATAKLTKSGVEDVAFLPMMIDNLYRPEVLKAGDPRFARVVDYMDWASVGFEHSFSIDGDEVRVGAK